MSTSSKLERRIARAKGGRRVSRVPYQSDEAVKGRNQRKARKKRYGGSR